MRFDRPAGTVLRLPMVYGEYDPRLRLLPYLQRMQNGRSHIFLDERSASWVPPRGYVGNIAHALALTVTQTEATNRIYHVAEPHSAARTEREFIQAVGEAFGWDGEIVALPPSKLPRDMRFNPHGQNLPTDSTRIRDELGYAELHTFEQGLARTLAWYREQVLPNADPIDYTAEDTLLRNL